MRLIRNYLNILFFILFAGVTYGQPKPVSWKFNYTHFGISNGLPSSETYQVYQDRSGLVWILTDRGVARYDGFRFKIYTTENGLSDNVNFRVVEDSGGSLWFIGLNGKLSVYKNEEMQPYRFNHKLHQAIQVGSSGNTTIHVNPDGSLVYTITGYSTLLVSKTGQVKDVTDYGITNKGSAYLLEMGADFLPQRRSADLVTDFRKVFLIRGKKKLFLGETLFRSFLRAKRHKKHLFLMSDYKVHLVYGQRIQLVSGDHQVIALDCDDQFIYIGYYKNGVEKYRFDPKTKKLVLVGRYLSNYSVSSTYSDRNGALWFTTLEKGVYVLYDDAFQQLFVNGNRLKEEIRFVTGNKKKVILTYYVGKWQQLYPPFLSKNEQQINFYYPMLPSGTGFVFCKGIVDWSGWKDVNDRYAMVPSYATDTSVLGLDINKLELVETGRKSETRYTVSHLIKSGEVGGYNYFYFTGDHKVFILFIKGVFVFALKDGKIQKTFRPVLMRRLDRLTYNRVWGLMAYSSGEGLHEINEKTEQAKEFYPELQLGKQIVRIFFDEKDRLWVANKKGIFLLEKKQGKASIRFFLNRDRLSCAEIMDMYSYDDVLYLATKSGVQRINIRKAKRPNSENPVSLISIQAFSQNKALKQEGTIYPAETDLIRIFLLNKSLNRRNHYRYRFGEHETWVLSDKGEIILNHPPNGNYTLEVSYLDGFNHWTKPVKLVVFEVDKIVFLRWYFILLYGVLLVGLFYAVVKLFLRSVNRKNYMLNRMIELEQMALSAQMNPHFIFNSLNSIHSFLLYEENERAEKYLIRFAKLIRQTLSNSRVTYITIEEEVETLKNYILLENMRFKDHFDFEIESDLQALPSYPCIPPMLIQPYIENAIIHGLSKRIDGAKLKVTFVMEEEQLKVFVEDNGIGYTESKKHKRDTGHKSYGTQITEERLKSLQSRSKKTFSATISNLDDSDPEFPGTRVVLIIPIPDQPTT